MFSSSIAWNLRVLPAAVLAGLATSGPALAQTSSPGAVKSNGNFFVLENVSSGIYGKANVYEYRNSSDTNGYWVRYGPLSYGSYAIDSSSVGLTAPACLTPSGGFFFVAKNTSGEDTLWSWDAASGLTWHGHYLSNPIRLAQRLSGSSVFYSSGYAIFEWNPGGLYLLSPPSSQSFSLAPPCVVNGNVLGVCSGGPIYERNAGTWNYVGPVYGQFIGGEMPGKAFVTTLSGELTQVFKSGGVWTSYPHHAPAAGYSCDAPPVSIADGRVFVTAHNSSVRELFELRYDQGTGQWIWSNHHAPSGTTFSGNIAGGYNYSGISNRAVVKGTDGHYYVNYDAGSSWRWRDLGVPHSLLDSSTHQGVGGGGH